MMEELPSFKPSTKLTALMNQTEQARRYAENVGRDALVRQMRLARGELPKRKRKAN
jgi:hypothetical protein